MKTQTVKSNKFISFIKKHSELTLALVKTIVLALALFVSFGVILGVHTATNEYMNPGVKYHDNVIYSRMGHEIVLRDVIVYKYNGETYLGRVVGLPGDTISVDADGYFFNNGHLVYEENIKYSISHSQEIEVTLKDNEYFVLNDDRSQNFDSRTFGPISKDDVKGKVLIVIRRYGI